MAGLSPALKQLVEAGKRAARPTDADQVRIFDALQVRLALASGVAVVTPGSIRSADYTWNRAALSTAVKSVSTAFVVVGLAIVGWLFSGRTDYRGSALSFSAAVASVHSSDLAESEPTTRHPPLSLSTRENDLAETPPESSEGRDTTKNARDTHDSLAEEVDTLLRAERALHRGKPEQALVLLNEHERKFRKGVLTEERTAARIQALCSLGRLTEAESLLSHLSPKSVYGRSARRACASVAPASSAR
jgi:hypothetical protein